MFQGTPHAWVVAGMLAAASVAGCAAVDAPILTGLFDEDPESWKHLPAAERYVRGWRHYERGVSYAKSAAIRNDHRLTASGCDRAVEGLRICASAAESDEWKNALVALGTQWSAMASYARNGRLYRPRRRIERLAAEAAGYEPAAVHFAGSTPAAGTTPSAGTDEQPTPAAGGPVKAIPTGTVFRKRTEIDAGPTGEVTTHILVVLQRGGAMVEAIVPKELWDRAVLGEPVPKPAATDDAATPPGDGPGKDG